MALFVMLSLSTYSRPSELLRCRTFSLIRPSPNITKAWSLLLSPEEMEVTSKTGDFDVSLMLDSPYLLTWVGPLLQAMKKKSPELPLWDFTYSQYLNVFKKCSKMMQMELSPYHSRHSGPSVDRSRHYRTQLEVQKRGQWRSTKSVARYEKSARLAKSWESVPEKTKTFCSLCEQSLGDIMLGRKLVPMVTSLEGIQRGTTLPTSSRAKVA